MNEEAVNTSVRTFLKAFGVAAQRKIKAEAAAEGTVSRTKLACVVIAVLSAGGVIAPTSAARATTLLGM